MSASSSAEKVVRAAKAQMAGAKSLLADPRQFWAIEFKRQTASPQTWRRAFHVLVDRVIASPGVVLYDAVESGVPTYMVDLIAGATGEPVTRRRPRQSRLICEGKVVTLTAARSRGVSKPSIGAACSGKRSKVVNLASPSVGARQSCQRLRPMLAP